MPGTRVSMSLRHGVSCNVGSRAMPFLRRELPFAGHKKVVGHGSGGRGEARQWRSKREQRVCSAPKNKQLPCNFNRRLGTRMTNPPCRTSYGRMFSLRSGMSESIAPGGVLSLSFEWAVSYNEIDNFVR